MKQFSVDKIKERFFQQETGDREFRERVKNVFKTILVRHVLPDFSHTAKMVVFKTQNKTLAQELFFQKAVLEKELQREVIIR